MIRYLAWVSNAVLFALCCFLVADTANAIFAVLLAPETDEESTTAVADAPTGNRWADRSVILERNLFNASLLAPATAFVEESEELEATKLPLDLVGTVASLNPELASAAVHDREQQRTFVVRVNEEVKSQAKVLRIERRRIVLSENGSPRELVLAETDTVAPAKPTVRKSARGRRVNRRSAARRPRAVDASARAPKPQPDAGRSLRNRAALFSQARFQEKYDGEAMLGMEVTNIKPQSLFEEAGLTENDVIQELNGIAIDAPEQTRAVLDAFATASELRLRVLRGGETLTLNYVIPEE